MNRNRLMVALVAVLLAACQRAEPLTQEKAQEIIGDWSFRRVPVYAEVPQKVWWTPRSPKDDYDEKAVRTLHNLERAGLVTIRSSVTADSATYTATVTPDGFRVLGTAPSVRGPVLRARICEQRYDGLRNFQRHPSQPTVGSGELVWHYENPTPLYALFETKIDKPLNEPYASLVSFWHEDGQWKFSVTVKKFRHSDATRIDKLSSARGRFRTEKSGGSATALQIHTPLVGTRTVSECGSRAAALKAVALPPPQSKPGTRTVSVCGGSATAVRTSSATFV